uniref:Bacterial Pleckstrin homology domain-containing protein n=1 Tax=Sphingobacterium sp. (strain 21) TaxID=743722 RepID=F4CBI6_SPHS2
MKESQGFTQGWIWTGLTSCVALMGFVFYTAVNKNEDMLWMVYLAVIGLLILLVFLVFLTANLSLQIDEKGIVFQFFPFQLRPKQIDWDKIKMASIISFDPIYNFKGWGIRKGRNKEKAYIVKGNLGLKLDLKNNECIIIGIQDKEKIKSCLDSYCRKEFSQ